MNFDSIKLGERIYAARKKKGLKQSEVYTPLGLHQSAYSDIETGKRIITIPLLYDIANVLETSVFWLLSEDTDMHTFTADEISEIEKYKDFVIYKRP